MKNILFLRHAKSAWSDLALSDHDRPLNRRGERSAKAVGDHLAHHGPRPELILCSTAMRARQTLAPMVKRLGMPAPPIMLEETLYLASEESLLERLQALTDDVKTVLLVGHNDGIWRLAELLAGRGPPALLAALQDKYPTGTLAVLRAPADAWRDLAVGTGELQAFIRPRDLTKR
ncbi:MAG: histidine phosphatase family protein [Reyranella sp.]|nr:histidine phosphatase family protein [Reyranella sp.]